MSVAATSRTRGCSRMSNSHDRGEEFLADELKEKTQDVIN